MQAPSDINLQNLDHIGTLGVGTFSRVTMVRLSGTTEIYALKIMKKTVRETRDSEKNCHI